LSPIHCPVKDGILAPHTVLACALHSRDAGRRICSSATISAVLQHLKPLLSPDVSNRLVIQAPPISTEQILHVSPASSRMNSRQCV
jgi:hypothetical protein